MSEAAGGKESLGRGNINCQQCSGPVCLNVMNRYLGWDREFELRYNVTLHGRSETKYIGIGSCKLSYRT